MSKLPLSLLVAGAAMLSTEAAAATYGASFYPNDPFFPYSKAELPDFAGQWHLENLAPAAGVGTMTAVNAGLDVNVKGAWAAGVTGRGVVIGIIDNGVEGDHEDLAENYRADLSKIFSQNAELAATEQRPVQADDDHGTAVAGVAAARGGNAIGVTGAAPFAQIAGQRISFSYTNDDPGLTPQDAADAFLWYSGVDATGQYTGEAQIHVKNNSWGTTVPFIGDEGNVFDKNTVGMKALSFASANNVIFLFAASNDRGGYREQAQTDTYNSSDPVITVAALGSDGVYSYYSCFGPNVFVTAPSNSLQTNFGITTTDRMGSAYGYNTYIAPATTDDTIVELLTNLPNANYTADFGGTSSATPLVAGIIALGKQVAPAMDVRLAKHALVKSSRIVDAAENGNSSGGRGWQTNAAGNAFNPNYGFGLIDATGFVNKVIESAYVTDRTAATTGTVVVNTAIPVGDKDGVVQKFTIAAALADQPIETVETRFKVTGPGVWQDLHITLTSPSGTVSDLLLFGDYLRSYAGVQPEELLKEVYAGNNEAIPGFDWNLVANNFWGENAAGEWAIQAWNRGYLNVGGNMQWQEYEVIINMGKLVLEGEASALRIGDGTTIKAHSLNLDYANFSVEAGGTFTVTDSVNVYGGTVDVLGTLNEGAPALNPTFNKGSLVTVGAGGSVVVRAGGTLVASRGITVNGGQFTNFGEIEIGTGSITVNGGGVFSSRQDLDIAGALTVGDNGSGGFSISSGSDVEPEGELTVRGGITLGAGGGYISVSGQITSIGATTINGGEFATSTFNAADVTINGGTLRITGTLTATDTVNVEKGLFDVRGQITAPNVRISGGASLNERGWFSPGGINRIQTLTSAEKFVSVVPSIIDGALEITKNGMLYVDVRNVRQPDGNREILFDTLHVTGAVVLQGSLYINRLPDNDGNLAQVQAGHEITLITSDTGISPLKGDEVDSTYATITPTLHYEVKTRTWVSGNEAIEDGEAYGIAVRDYAPVAIAFTPNQQSVANMLQRLWKDSPGGSSTTSELPPVRPIDDPAAVTTAAVPFPPVATPPNDGIDEDYDYETLFDSLDTVTTDDQLRGLYDQLGPLNSVVLGQTLRQQVRGQVGAARQRAREARSTFIPAGSFWTNTLFGDSYGFNYSAPLIASTNNGFIPFTPFDGYDEASPVTLWLNGNGSFTPGKANAITAGYDTYTANGAIGIDYRFANELLVGIFVSAGYSTTDFNNSGIKNESDTVAGAIYAAGHLRGLSTSSGSLHYNAVAGISADSHILKRNIAQGIGSDLNGAHKGKPDGTTTFASAEIGYEWTTFSRTQDGWSFGPSLAVQYYHSSIDGYTETGTNNWQRLAVGKQAYESFTTQLGFSISKLYNFSAVSVLPEFRASWIHEFNDDAKDIGARLASVPGARAFSIQGIAPTSDYASVGVGFSLRFSDHVSGTLDYDCYLFQDDVNPAHQLTATLRISF
jgi:subtilisin family serine protease/uncharacterized protein YhjY with autotransporter beta-barrel domain